MQFLDVKLIENGDGGDYELLKGDVSTISGFENMPYLALFGGNVEQDTTGPKDTEFSFDFWGNYLFITDDPKLWFNSTTERLINSTALNPSTRLEIEQAVKNDLSFMNDFANVEVIVYLLGYDRLKIEIKILEPTNEQPKIYVYIWDATEQELKNG